MNSQERELLACLLLPAAAVASPVYAADYLTAAQAQRALFPEADAFVPRPVTLSDEQKKQIRKRSGLRQRWDTQEVWRAASGDTFLGWFIVDNVIGKHEFITYGVALSPDGHVIGVEIMSYRETHGGEIRNPGWLGRFRGKTLADSFKLDRDIPNISGATLSCRNVLDGVKRLLALREVALAHE